jgi:uncharacterized protein YqeY
MTFDKIKGDMYAAMKNKDKLRKDVLSTIMANAKDMAIKDGADRENVSETIVNATLLKEKKLLQGMIDEFPENATSAEHLALLDTYKKKLAIVLEYAPQVIDDEDEIRAIIVATGIELDKKNMGKIMGALKGKKCDMGVANKVLTAMFQEAAGKP